MLHNSSDHMLAPMRNSGILGEEPSVSDAKNHTQLDKKKNQIYMTQTVFNIVAQDPQNSIYFAPSAKTPCKNWDVIRVINSGHRVDCQKYLQKASN